MTSQAAQTDARLDRVAERLNQVAALQTQDSSDIAEIDGSIATILRSQNRYEERQGRLDEILRDLADKQLKNEELFAENEKRFANLAAAQLKFESRQGRLEAIFEMLEEFVRDMRAETKGHFADVDRRIAALVEARARSDQAQA